MEKINLKPSAKVLLQFKTDRAARRRYACLIGYMNSDRDVKKREHSHHWKDGEDPRDKTRY